MTLMYKDFEDFLKEEHAAHYIGTDDDMPDAFDSWLADLDGEEFMSHAENYASHRLVEMKKNITNYIVDHEV